MSKILSLLVAGAILSTSYTHAQDFKILDNPLALSSEGCAPFLNQPNEYKDFVDFVTFLQNLSTDPTDSIQVTWTYLPDLTVQPTGWKIIGICDNILCRTEDDNWFTGTPQNANPFDNMHNMRLEAHIYAPTNGLNGTGTYHVQVKSHNQTDTAVFILNKYPLGVSSVLMTDKSIALYPNPASGVLNVFVDNKLKVKQISVYNIIGKEVTILNKTSNQEVSTLNLSQYSSGIYLIRFSDANGNAIATRKFTKQ